MSQNRGIAIDVTSDPFSNEVFTSQHSNELRFLRTDEGQSKLSTLLVNAIADPTASYTLA
jgi:hypothetical protein